MYLNCNKILICGPGVQRFASIGRAAAVFVRTVNETKTWCQSRTHLCEHKNALAPNPIHADTMSMRSLLPPICTCSHRNDLAIYSTATLRFSIRITMLRADFSLLLLPQRRSNITSTRSREGRRRPFDLRALLRYDSIHWRIDAVHLAKRGTKRMRNRNRGRCDLWLLLDNNLCLIFVWAQSSKRNEIISGFFPAHSRFMCRWPVPATLHNSIQLYHAQRTYEWMPSIWQ